MFKKQINILKKLLTVIQGNLSNTERLKIMALIIIETHARDVVANLYKSGKYIIIFNYWTTINNYPL